MRAFFRKHGVGAVVMVFSFVAWGAGAARAADAENVEALIRQGVELRHQGKDERALPFFQKAYGLSRTPRASGQLGLCEMAIGYWVDAEKHLGEALSYPEHPWIAKNLADLTASLGVVRKNISDVVIDGSPSGAEVVVNGQNVGRLPLAVPVRLGKGPAEIELRATGYTSASRSLKVAGGGTERVTIALEREATAAVPVATAPVQPLPGPSGGAEAATAVAPAGPPGERDAGPPSPRRPRRIAAWSTAAAGVLALGLGVVETAAWMSKRSDFDNHLGPLATNPAVTGKNCGSGDANYGGAGCQAIHDDLARARLLTFIGYGLAGGLGAVSAYLFATSSDDRPRSTAALVCTPDLIDIGAQCRLSF